MSFRNKISLQQWLKDDALTSIWRIRKKYNENTGFDSYTSSTKVLNFIADKYNFNIFVYD